MEKNYCDKCGKEIKEFGKSFSGSKWNLWGFSSSFHNQDFCSIKCLKEFLEDFK